MRQHQPLSRQWLLVKALQAARQGFTREQLAERLDCTTRCVSDDIGVLQELGLPVKFEVRRFGRRLWRMDSDAIERQGLCFTITEMISLFLSIELAAPLHGTLFGDGLDMIMRKITSVVPQPAIEHFRSVPELLGVKLAARHNYANQAAELRMLRRAVDECRSVRVVYDDASADQIITSEFHPYGLLFKDAGIYCHGYLALHEAIRTLKVIRIRSLKLGGGRFTRPAGFSPVQFVSGSFGVYEGHQPQTVEVCLTGWAARDVLEQEWHTSQKILSKRGGKLVVRYQLTDTTELKRWLLGYGRYATVLKPATLAEEMVAEARALVGNYPSRRPN